MYNGKEIRTRSTAKVNQTAFGKDKVVKPHIPVDPMGYWNPANWGKPVTIPSNMITGRGINQPLIGVDDLGTVKPILPGQPVIQFPGSKVTEFPIIPNKQVDPGWGVTPTRTGKPVQMPTVNLGRPSAGDYNRMRGLSPGLFMNGGVMGYKKGGENTCPPGYVLYKGQCVKWEEPNVQNVNKGSGGYDALTQTISINPNVPEHLQDWWMEHEKFHHLQNLAGGLSSSGMMGERPNPFVASSDAIGAYYDLRPKQVEAEIDEMIKENPELQFIPRNLLRKGSSPGFIGADSRIYSNDDSVEEQAREYEKNFIKTDQSMFPMKKNGGISKNYFDVMLSDDEILQYKNGGFVVQDLPKAQDGFSEPSDNIFYGPGDSEYDRRKKPLNMDILEKNWNLYKNQLLNKDDEQEINYRINRYQDALKKGTYDTVEARFGGALPKAQNGNEGNEYYAYEGRPDSYYRKVNGQWQILNSSTNGKFIEIKDPKGERTKLLNAQAYPIGAEATKKLNEWGMQVRTSNTPTVKITVPKLDELRGGVTQAPTQNIFANPAYMTSYQLQQKGMSMAPTAEGAKWLEMAAAQKKNEEAQKEYADRKATQARYDRASGAGSGSSTYVAPSYVGFQKQEEVAPSNEPLPYVMAGTDEKGNATLITQAQKQEVDQAVAKDMAINAALRDRQIIEQITGKELTDEEIYGEDGQYNPNLTKYSSGDWQQQIADQRYQNFVDANQKAYDNAAWYDKGASVLSNLISDPVLTIGNWTEGNTNLYGQSYMLRDELNPEAQGYARRYSNADDYWLNDWVNMINPGAIGADAGVNYDQGQYLNMAGNIASLIPVSKASKIFSGVKNITPIKNFGHAAHEVLDTPLRTYLKPSSVGNAIVQSGESGLTNSLLNLTPSNMLAHYSRIAAPTAWYNYSQNPTAGGFADALLLSAGVPEVWQGAAALREGSRYIKPYAQTVKNIATGEAPLSLQSFKRSDLFRLDSPTSLQKYADDYAAALKGDGQLSATRDKFASSST